MRSVVVHYKELALKGKNRPWFIQVLLRNLKTALAGLHVRAFRSSMGRLEIELGAENRSFQERVRLFSPAELTTLLEEEGLLVDATFGDYDGGPLDGRATRTILVATRP